MLSKQQFNLKDPFKKLIDKTKEFLKPANENHIYSIAENGLGYRHATYDKSNSELLEEAYPDKAYKALHNAANLIVQLIARYEEEGFFYAVKNKEEYKKIFDVIGINLQFLDSRPLLTDDGKKIKEQCHFWMPRIINDETYQLCRAFYDCISAIDKEPGPFNFIGYLLRKFLSIAELGKTVTSAVKHALAWKLQEYELQTIKSDMQKLSDPNRSDDVRNKSINEMNAKIIHLEKFAAEYDAVFKADAKQIETNELAIKMASAFSVDSVGFKMLSKEQAMQWMGGVTKHIKAELAKLKKNPAANQAVDPLTTFQAQLTFVRAFSAAAGVSPVNNAGDRKEAAVQLR